MRTYSFLIVLLTVSFWAAGEGMSDISIIHSILTVILSIYAKMSFSSIHCKQNITKPIVIKYQATSH